MVIFATSSAVDDGGCYNIARRRVIRILIRTIAVSLSQGLKLPTVLRNEWEGSDEGSDGLITDLMLQNHKAW